MESVPAAWTTTGEFVAGGFPLENLYGEINKISAKEIVTDEKTCEILQHGSYIITDSAKSGTLTLNPFGLWNRNKGIPVARLPVATFVAKLFGLTMS